jgi:outer membrane protein assembly factor BamE (lipoprotein component of BamABCDE complex)
MKNLLTILLSIVMFSCAANSGHTEIKTLSLGTVQAQVEKGKNQTEILKFLGSPNIITMDSQGGEVWTYDKISSDRKSSGGFLLFIFNPFNWFGSGGGSMSKSSSSSKSLTVIITFDDNKNVIDFSYQSLKY